MTHYTEKKNCCLIKPVLHTSAADFAHLNQLIRWWTMLWKICVLFKMHFIWLTVHSCLNGKCLMLVLNSKFSPLTIYNNGIFLLAFIWISSSRPINNDLHLALDPCVWGLDSLFFCPVAEHTCIWYAVGDALNITPDIYSIFLFITQPRGHAHHIPSFYLCTEQYEFVFWWNISNTISVLFILIIDIDYLKKITIF